MGCGTQISASYEDIQDAEVNPIAYKVAFASYFRAEKYAMLFLNQCMNKEGDLVFDENDNGPGPRSPTPDS